MVSRRDLLLGLGASVVALAALPGCRPSARVLSPQLSRFDVEAWALGAVTELLRHGPAAWCNVVRTRDIELVFDVLGESQAPATNWQLQLGITRANGSSETRTIETISLRELEATVAAMTGAAKWTWAPVIPGRAAVQAYGALQPIDQLIPQQGWRAALRQLHATFTPLLHSRIIYHAVTLQLQVQERWCYHRGSDSANQSQPMAAAITRQLWQCITATRQRDQLDFAHIRRGSSNPTPLTGFVDNDLKDLINRALRHETPSDPPRGAVRVLLASVITVYVLTAAQLADLAVPQLSFAPLQADAYGRTPLRADGLPPVARPTTAPSRIELADNQPAHFMIDGGTADVATLRDQPEVVYLLEAGDVSVSHLGDVVIWPTWALELVKGVTSGRAYRLPVVRTTVTAILAAQASSDRESVLVAPPTLGSAPFATIIPTTMWSATAPWYLLTAEFA